MNPLFYILSLIICHEVLTSLSYAAAPNWDVSRNVMYVPDPDWDPAAHVTPGAIVYAYVKNTTAQPMLLDQLSWNGVPAITLANRAPYTTVWWRLNPASIPPGGFGELALRLRTRPKEQGQLNASFKNGPTLTLKIAANRPAFRIQTISMSKNRRQVYLYIEREPDTPTNTLPDTVLLDGLPITVKWLSPAYAGTLRVALAEFETALIEGAWHTWSVRSHSNTDNMASATLRVIADPVALGIAGNQGFAYYATNGINDLHSFHFVNHESLNQAAQDNLRIVMHVQSSTNIPSGHATHPAVMGYNIFDEPDVADDAAGTRLGRAWADRIGITAMDMIARIQDVSTAAPQRPVFMTVNMTFMPANYYTYGPLADITTTDFYPITHTLPVVNIRAAAAHARRAAAPRPAGFIFQCGWEEFSIDINGPPWNGWAGHAAIKAKGLDAFRDTSRTRGFGRPPAGGEIELQMAYLLGEGIKSFWGYNDATECCQGLLFHGASDIPEAWSALTRMMRILHQVKAEIALGHPINWAVANHPRLQVRTLVCGQDAALVVVTNEDHTSNHKGLTTNPTSGIITFSDFPWLKAGRVQKVDPDGPTEVQSHRGADGISWSLDKLQTTVVFRISASNTQNHITLPSRSVKK